MKAIDSKREKIREIKERRKKARNVQIVSCPSAFPISNKSGGLTNETDESVSATPTSPLPQRGQPCDWIEVSQEVRQLGASTFEGAQKRNFKDEQYQLLTGRKRKKHHVPLPIVRGIKKKAAEREAKRLKEAREAGIVLPKKAKTDEGKRDASSRVHGPAPSIGFMSKGVFRLKRKP